MNILIIPTNDWERAAGAGHINEIAEELAQRGHRVYAWNFNLYRQQPIKRPPRNVKLIFSKTLPFRDPAIFFTLNALFQAPAIFRSIHKNKINVIINENVLFGLIAYFASGEYVLKVFDFSDYFPESASVYYTASSQATKKLVEGTTLAITKLNIKFSNICIAVCQSLIKTTLAIDKTKPCYLITNGVHANSIIESQKTPVKNDKPSMVVMGVIDAWLDFQTPIAALKKLVNQYPNLKLIIIGPWLRKELRQQVENEIKNLKLESSIEITGYISNQQLKQYLQQATCFVMPYNLDMFYSNIRLPEKLFVYSAYGKPILSTSLPEVAALKTEHVFLYHNEKEFKSILEEILIKEKMQLDLKQKAQKFALEHDFRVLAKQLEAILTDESRKI